MERSTCFHCTHVFDLDNLKKECRRDVRKIHGEVDIIKVLASCYDCTDIEFENRIRVTVESYHECYICNKCFNNIKALNTSLRKTENLKEALKCSASSNGLNSLWLTPSNGNDHPLETLAEDSEDTPQTVQSTNGKKRQRDFLTPVKSGCTPRRKKAIRATPKTNRRRLNFCSETPSHVHTPMSPGPRVKVQIGFRGRTRHTALRGHDKLACRAIVMKQYKTAVNHLMNIEEVKKNIASTLKKTICREITKLCAYKKCVLRLNNMHQFSWRTAFRQLQTICPITTDMMQCITGEKTAQMPRIVSSLGVLLFTRNQSLSTLQAINSVFMFRGHVRTRVYSTFNRAGLCKSYKSTISTIDKICEHFDEPVKKWAQRIVEKKTDKKITSNSVYADHSYGAPDLTQDNDVSYDTHVQCISEDHSYSSPVMYTAEPIECASPTTTSSEDIPGTPETLQPNYVTMSTPDQMMSPVQDMESPFTTVPKEISTEVSGFQIVMDNLNMQQKARHKTSENVNKTHNLTHSIAVQDRVDSSGLDDIHPQADILSVPEDAFIPSIEDHQALYNDFKILIQRALVEYLPAFEDFRDLVTYHIDHEHLTESAKKSNVIPLGILEKDENITEQMIDIMEHLQEYVPKTNGKMCQLLLGGDALSVERGESAQRARADSITPEERLHGFVWKSEDWHAHVTSLQDTFDIHFKGTSSGERGTMFQLRNYFDRRGVKAEVKDSVNDCREFLRFITKGLIIIAAMNVLEFGSLSDELPVDICSSTDTKTEFLDSVASKIINKFVETEPVKFDKKTTAPVSTSRFPCGHPGCTKTFAVDGKCRNKHRTICPYKDFPVATGIPTNDANEAPTANKDSTENLKFDGKFNYSCSLLRDGLMDWCREDAAKENDGNRLVRLWRFDMLRYSLTNHTKYRLLAFRLQAQLIALLPPKLASQLLHNRCVNIHGGPGGNVPGDLALEFMNMRAKDALNSLHGNLTSASIQRGGRSLQGCNHIVDSYTEGLEQYFGKPSNSKPSLRGDIQKLVKHLLPEDLFKNIPGRSHKSFKEMRFNPLEKLNVSKLKTWITEKREEFSKSQRIRSYYI